MRLKNLSDGGVEIIKRFILGIIIFFMAAPSLAYGDLRSFIPRLYSTGAELAVDSFYRSEDNTSTEASGFDRKHFFSSERVYFTATGWIYHPRFILFLTKLGLGLDQDYLAGTERSLDVGFTNSIVHEYEFRALILPEHPYNLELYTLRTNPYITGTFTRGVETVAYRTGAVFNYKQQPYKYFLSYNMSTLESSRYTTDTKSLDTSASYTKKWGSFAGAFSRTNSDTSFASVNSKSTLDKYSLENNLRFLEKKIYLTSNISRNTIKQEDSFRSFDDSRLAWTENLYIELPWNFNIQLYNNYFTDDSKTREFDTGLIDELWNKSDTAGINIQQKLYNSLTANYNFNYLSTKSSTGDSKGTNQSFSIAYIKNIPRGVLDAGVSLGRSVIERTDSPVIINQPYTIRISEQFQLPVDVDQASIRIRVRDDETGIFLDMVENVHFLVSPGVFVQIIGVPADASNPDPFHAYTLQVTYSLVPENAKIQTDSYAYSIKLHMFDYFFTPYYSRSHSEQKVLAGSLFGEPNKTTTDILGVLFQKDPYTLELQYLNTDSTDRLEKQYSIEAKYQHAITPGTQLNVRAYFSKSRITVLSVKPITSYDQNLLTGEIRIQKYFPKKNLTTTLGGIISKTTGLADTTRYYADASVAWQRGKLRLKAGLRIGSTVTKRAVDETEPDSGTAEEGSFTQFYYLSLRRTLF